jgi:hypothetical protein
MGWVVRRAPETPATGLVMKTSCDGTPGPAGENEVLVADVNPVEDAVRV